MRPLIATFLRRASIVFAYTRKSGAVITAVAAAFFLAACQSTPVDDETAPSPVTGPADEVTAASFEVWALDQADTVEDGGGLLYIWNGDELGSDAPSDATAEVIDLGAAAEAAGCELAQRPHMVLPNNSTPPTHMIISNVASGDTHFMDIETREITGCVNTAEGFDGAGGSHAAHASVASPDDSFVLVADMNHGDDSGYLHKIQTDFSSDTYELTETIALDEYAAELESDFVRPICHEFTPDGAFAYVTLAQGGLLIVDAGTADGTTPMDVVQVHPAASMPGAGCGAFPVSDDLMLTNGESGASGGDDFLFFHNTSGVNDGDFPEPFTLELPGEDTHGTAFCTDEDEREYALTFMRVSNDINVVDIEAREVVATESIATGFSPNPAPDLAYHRDGKIYVSLRGAEPLTAINSLIDAERTPGVAVLTVSDDCRSFTWTEDDLLTMEDNPNTVNVAGNEVSAADPHGLAVIER